MEGIIGIICIYIYIYSLHLNASKNQSCSNEKAPRYKLHRSIMCDEGLSCTRRRWHQGFEGLTCGKFWAATYGSYGSCQVIDSPQIAFHSCCKMRFWRLTSYIISFYIMSYCISYTFILPALDMSSDLPTLTFKKKTLFSSRQDPSRLRARTLIVLDENLICLFKKDLPKSCSEKQPVNQVNPAESFSLKLGETWRSEDLRKKVSDTKSRPHSSY